MAKLILNPTSPQRQEVVLPRSLLSIGRDPSNDLVLPDAMVSRRHAVIELRGNQYFVRDCSSSNGSLVNGDRVSERGLRDGDLVAIGTARLLFREDVEALDAAGKVVQHPSAPRLRCPQCGTDYRRGDLFCKQCGGTLQAPEKKSICTACGTAVPLPAKFCNACGARLTSEESASVEPTKQQPVGLPSDALPTPPAGYSKPDVEAPSAHEGPAAPAPISASEEPKTAPKPLEPMIEAAAPPPPKPAPAFAVPVAPAASSRKPGEKTVPPPRGPRPISVAAGGAATAPAADSSVAPAVLVARQAPPRPDRRPGELVGERTDRAAGADLVPRALAGLIDILGVCVVQAALLAPAAYYWWTQDFSGGVATRSILLSLGLVSITVVLGAVYFIYFWGVRGATPGKRLVGLAVEASDGSYPIGVSRASVRFLGYLVSGALLGGGFLLIALDGSGLHDRIAGTRVVRRKA